MILTVAVSPANRHCIYVLDICSRFVGSLCAITYFQCRNPPQSYSIHSHHINYMNGHTSIIKWCKTQYQCTLPWVVRVTRLELNEDFRYQRPSWICYITSCRHLVFQVTWLPVMWLTSWTELTWPEIQVVDRKWHHQSKMVGKSLHLHIHVQTGKPKTTCLDSI